MVIVVGAVAGLACSSRPRIMECGSFSVEDYEDEIARFAPSTSIDVGGIKHEYVLNGSQIVLEKWTENGVEHMMVFLYDDVASPIGFLYRTSAYAQDTYDAYFYEKNLFGDVIAIYNDLGACVASYSYDAWGNHSVTRNVNGIATMNPIRYRGYYYDTHTGLYYLQSRYYNPEMGRFISPDCYVSTGQGLHGNNMYIYCNNNPVMGVDPTGEFWSEIWNFAKTVVSEIGYAMQWMSPAYAGCGGVALADGVLPVGDVVALVGVTVLTAGAIGIGVCKAAKSQSQSKNETEVKSTTNSTSSNGPTIIYRYGGTNPGNLTPKSKDRYSGLSFSTIPMPGAAMTTIEALNATGIVYAVQDSPHHVSVKPVVGSMEDWINQGSDSVWTQAVKSVVIKFGG